MSLDVREAVLEPAEERLRLSVSLHNAADRTVHAYATVRRIVYHDATHTLEVDLSDEETPLAQVGGTFVLPKFKAFDPKREGVLRLDLPRVLNRMAAGQNEVSPKIESIPLDNVQHVDVRVAWSDTPFYDDKRDERKPVVTQLVDWKKGLAQARVQVRPERGSRGA